MNPENNSQEQDENLKEMNYSPENDIFNQEKAIPLDGDGNPLTGDRQTQKMPFGLDIPGYEDDDNFEQMNGQIPIEDESLHEKSDLETIQEEKNPDDLN